MTNLCFGQFCFHFHPCCLSLFFLCSHVINFYLLAYAFDFSCVFAHPIRYFDFFKKWPSALWFSFSFFAAQHCPLCMCVCLFLALPIQNDPTVARFARLLLAWVLVCPAFAIIIDDAVVLGCLSTFFCFVFLLFASFSIFILKSFKFNFYDFHWLICRFSPSCLFFFHPSFGSFKSCPIRSADCYTVFVCTLNSSSFVSHSSKSF